MRMLGKFTTGGCWSGPRHNGRPCIPPGPDCSGWERNTRRRKRRERRELRREIDEAVSRRS
jgi:hypothetical protein